MEETVLNFLSKHRIDYKSKLVIGLNQAQRSISRLKMIVIAKNIQDQNCEISRVVSLCHINNIPVVFACTRNKLSSVFNVRYGISCVGIRTSVQISEDFNVIQEMMLQNRIIWRLNFSVLSSTIGNSRNESPIWIAAHNGYNDPEILSESVANGWNINEPDSYNGYTPLMISIKKNHYLWVEWLLNDAADVQGRSFTGENPIFLAFASNSIESFKILLRSLKRFGKDKLESLILQKNFANESCLHIARSNGNLDLFMNILSDNGMHLLHSKDTFTAAGDRLGL